MADEKEKIEFKLADVKFYASVLQPTGEYTVHDFGTMPELLTFVRGLVDRDTSVFCFAGTQLKISKPPMRYLLTPWGHQPLFDLPNPDALEPDDTGYLGVDPVYFEEPPQIKMPPMRAPNTGAADEFFSDDDGGAENIFDTILPDPDN